MLTVLLKGPAVADRYYPDPSLRTFADVDLWMTPRVGGRARRPAPTRLPATWRELVGDVAKT